MDCPRCGQAAVTEAACPRCGVIVAKARSTRAGPAARPPAPPSFGEPSPPPSTGMSGLAMGLIAALLVLGGAVGSRLWERAHRAPSPAPVADTAAAPRPASVAGDVPPPSLTVETPPPIRALQMDPGQLPDADRTRADALLKKLSNPSSLTAADVQTAEDLFAHHPDERAFRDLLEAVLLGAADRHLRQRQFAQAIAYLQRAKEIQPSSTRPGLALMQIYLDTNNWTGAEGEARAVLAVNLRSFDAWQGLGYALMRQDRNRDALEALRSALDIRDDTNVRLLMERIQKGLADERGMAERRVSHFSVRYDGGEHEAVGREIVRALERHYATLATALDYEPTNTITVILFTQEGYYNASGAPRWSGGVFDLLDGRIRVPIGGLTTTLTPDMDETLIHELTHAFVADRVRGVSPEEIRIIQEGLAQYMEGKRLESMLTRAQLTALADGRIGGVMGFYLSALSFVEYLIANRGLGGINDLLKVMGETGSVDEAFRQVHGTSLRGAEQAWEQRFRQQHGSG
jgi:tetratricopeptide (TPR) repeat protein